MSDTKKVKVTVDESACIGCGACVAVAGEIYDFNEDRKSYVIKQPENDEEIQLAQDGADACCVECIYIKEESEE